MWRMDGGGGSLNGLTIRAPNGANKEVPSLRVLPIEDKISETDLLRLEGIETKRGVLCSSQKNQQWLFLEGSNQGICDARVRSGTKCQCKNCWDATLCKGVKDIQGVFFNSPPPKISKCRPVTKFFRKS